jgi:hypothetical protein
MATITPVQRSIVILNNVRKHVLTDIGEPSINPGRLNPSIGVPTRSPSEVEYEIQDGANQEESGVRKQCEYISGLVVSVEIKSRCCSKRNAVE